MPHLPSDNNADVSCNPTSCGCPTQKMYLSFEEEEVLSRMRELKLCWRDLQRQKDSSSDSRQRTSIERRIADLRTRFEALKVALREANHDKLRRLGHEP